LGGLFGRHPDELAGQDRVLLAALECFVERGYHGTTIRQIATRGGVSAPGLYHYFPMYRYARAARIYDGPDEVHRASSMTRRSARTPTSTPTEWTPTLVIWSSTSLSTPSRRRERGRTLIDVGSDR
jgi:hypothetical protein